MAVVSHVILPIDECEHQAITWVNVDPDLCHHMASLGHKELTYWGLYQTNTILHKPFSDAFLWKKTCGLIQISRKFVPKVHIVNNWTLVQVMAASNIT